MRPPTQQSELVAALAPVAAPVRNRRRKRALVSLLILGSLTCIVTVNTGADFSAGTNYTGQTFATAKVQINGNNQNDAASLALNLSNMVPGDTVTKTLNVVNDGDTDVLSYALSTVATTSSSLDTGAPSPLRIWISRCTVAWSAGVCSGGSQANLVGTAGAPAALIFANQSLATPPGGTGIFCKQGYGDHAVRGVGACDIANPASTDYLQLRVNLNSSGAPGSGADNALQGLTTTVKFVFSGRQPAAHGF